MLAESPRFIEPNKPPQALMPGIMASLEISERKPPRTPANRTARHEAKHAVAALENNVAVSKVTIIPGEGYLGLTVLANPDAIAALAPHATGEDGTGHDVRIAEMIGSAGAASAARSIIENNMDKVNAVACALEDHGTLDYFGVKDAIAKLNKPKKEFGVLHIVLPTGEKLKEEVTVKDNVIMEQDVWYRLAEKIPQLN